MADNYIERQQEQYEARKQTRYLLMQTDGKEEFS